MSQDSRLHEFLGELDARRVSYRLDRVRDAVMVQIPIPGERWEVEFFVDGHVEAERFASDGSMYDEAVLPRLIEGAS